MEVILIEAVEKLGKKGDIVKVKDGFFRNYLFPRHKAISYSPSSYRVYEERKARELTKDKEDRTKWEEMAERLKAMTLTLKAKIGADEKLFGSITAQQIAESLEEQGILIDRKKIEMVEPIKKSGTYPVRIKLHPEIESTLKVKIVKG